MGESVILRARQQMVSLLEPHNGKGTMPVSITSTISSAACGCHTTLTSAKRTKPLSLPHQPHIMLGWGAASILFSIVLPAS